MTKMKFGDMPAGTIFRENMSYPRRFVKIQTKLPSGLTNKCYRTVSGVTNWGEIVPEDNSLIPFNSIDIDSGVTASCPEWVEFVVISGFKKRQVK